MEKKARNIVLLALAGFIVSTPAHSISFGSLLENSKHSVLKYLVPGSIAIPAIETALPSEPFKPLSLNPVSPKPFYFRTQFTVEKSTSPRSCPVSPSVHSQSSNSSNPGSPQSFSSSSSDLEDSIFSMKMGVSWKKGVERSLSYKCGTPMQEE